ncbi:MAG TPA: hypothetical protein VJB97_04285, partial [Candidatus Paceibacterota bacterium]
DVGGQVTIVWRCEHASSTKSVGFNTGGALFGTTTRRVSEASATTTNYSLTCLRGEKTADAECSVDVARPTIILIANPQSVVRGETSTIGWTTTGMESCVVSSPHMPEFTTRNAGNTSVNGVAETSPITFPVRVDLECTTQGGATRTVQTNITVK